MARGAPDSSGSSTTDRVGAWRLWTSISLVLAAGLFAFWGTWNGQFLFDDHPAIEGNAALCGGDWWGAAFGARHHPLANRPLATLSLVIDFAVFGVSPFGPHLGNLLLHLGNAVLLLLTLRRLFVAPNLTASFAATRANGLAVAIAALWVVHPLATDAVAYATQRSTLLFSGCLLATLYCVLRAMGGSRRRWLALAVATMACGMASKEDFVVVPLLLPLFVRAFLVPTWRGLRTWIAFFAASAATWLVLVGCLALGPKNATVGFDTVPRVGAAEWLMTQAGVVLHYLRLGVWPYPLRGAYDWDYVRDAAAALVPGALVLGVLAWTVLAWRRRPWLGWLGAMFFLLLAPTSSVMPIVTEVVAERRAYLPMLFVLVPLTLLVARTLRSPVVAALVTLGSVAALGWVARSQVAVYADEAAFWADAYTKRTPDSRSFLAAQILSNHGAMLFNQGKVDQSCQLFDAAMQCEQPTSEERVHYAVSLQARGRAEAARAELEAIVAQYPDDASAQGALGTVLVALAQDDKDAGRRDAVLIRSERALQRAVELAPLSCAFWNSLGCAFELRERWSEAEGAYRRATELSPQRVEPFLGRARVLARLGRNHEIAPLFEPLLAAMPTDVGLRVNLAQMMIAGAELEFAKRLLRDAVRLDPGQTQAAAALRDLEVRSR